MKKPFVVACIPAFGEEATIAKVILQTHPYVDRILVCDDGSADMTGQIAEALGAVLIKHEKNQGKGQALRSLFEKAIGLNPDVIVLLDADGQHDPKEIQSLVDPILQDDADVVVGSRYADGGSTDAPLHRRVGLRFINFLNKRVNGISTDDTECGFRAYSPKAVRAVLPFDSEGFGVESETLKLATENGLRIREVPISVKYKGLPNTSKKAPVLHGFEVVTNIVRLIVEEHPLLYLGVPGLMLMATGMASAVYQLIAFDSTRFSLHLAVVILGMILVGLTLIISSFMLYALARIRKKLLHLRIF